MKSYFENKPQLFVLLFVITVLAILSSPFWLWQMKPEKELDILIVDKTVPDKSYREHKGLTWVLNNEKYRKADGENYSAVVDYVGFQHKENNSFIGERLPEQIDDFDVIYLADLYGVYEEEFSGENEAGRKSQQLYGGLQPEEVDINEILFRPTRQEL